MSPSRTGKIQRWMDLIGALLRRRYGVTFEELVRDVPAYARAPKRVAMMRMFERDKDELRAFGVPIETVVEDEGELVGYLLRRRDFYLPYLAVATDGEAPAGQGRRIAAERPGYRDLPRIVLDPGELAAVDAAALRVRQLGDPVLAADAEAAIRKLAFDLPPGSFVSSAPATFRSSGPRVDGRVFEFLDLALRHRKRLAFSYRAPDRSRAERREVEPYGLFFLGGHWFLAARDRGHGALCRFRLDRMEDLDVNRQRMHSPDYDMPDGFDLREQARWRWPWELGVGEGVEAIVTFHIADGATAAAARLGEIVSDDECRRRFRVHRMSAFARWLVSFGGDAIPVSPPGLVSAFRACVRETLASYRRDDGRLPRPGLDSGSSRATPS